MIPGCSAQLSELAPLPPGLLGDALDPHARTQHGGDVVPSAALDPAVVLGADGAQRRRHYAIARKLPWAQRSFWRDAPAETADDRAFLDIIGGDTDDDDPAHPVGSVVRWSALLSDDEADQVAHAPNLLELQRPTFEATPQGAPTRGISFNRGANSGGTGTTATTTIAGSDTDRTADSVRKGDAIFLVLVVNAANSNGVGTPTGARTGSAWSLVAVASNASGLTMMVWRRLATADDQAMTTPLTVSVALGASRLWLLAPVYLPAGSFDPAGTIVATAAAGSGGETARVHPAATAPNLSTATTTKYVIALAPIAVLSQGGGYITTVRHTTAPWISFDWGDSPLCTVEGAYAPADGAVVPAAGPVFHDTLASNKPYVGLTLLIPPVTYPAPQIKAADILDTATAAVGSGAYTDIGPVTVDSGGLALGNAATRRGTKVVDFRGGSFTVHLSAVSLPAGNDVVAFALGIGSNNRFVVVIYRDPADQVTKLGLGMYSAGAYISPGGGSWTLPSASWLRVREDGGVAVLEYSSNPYTAGWKTFYFIAHTMADDQLAGLSQIELYTIGTATATFDLINPTGITLPPAPIPSARSAATMRTPSTPDAAFPGTRALGGMCDQGSTLALRTKRRLTRVAAAAFAGAPPTGLELWPGQIHGCLTTADAIPAGGRFAEAMITAASGSADFSVMAAGMRYCAITQGAAVVNISYGGDPGVAPGTTAISDVFDAVIAAGLDVVFTISIGNSNGAPAYPAAYGLLAKYRDFVLPVIAWNDATDTRASFSNHPTNTADGAWCLAAPGQQGRSLGPSGIEIEWSGTSESAPYVAWCLLQLCDVLGVGPRRALALARAGARDTGQPATEQGAGVVSLAGALGKAGALGARTLLALT